MVKCNICRKEHSPLLPRQFHRFPIDPERLEKWFNSIGHTVNAYKNARICSDHFTKDDYYDTGTPVPSRRLKKTAIPSVFTQRSCRLKKDSRSNIQNDNQDESIMDIKHESTMDIQHQESIMDIKHESTMDIQHQESIIDIKHESTMDIQHQFTIDIQQSTIDIQHDNLILTEPTLVKNSDTGRRKKRHNINDREIIFLKTGKYNIECIRKTEFATNQAWIKFVKYVNYNRYLHKLFVTQKSREQKKMLTMQSVIQTLKRKNDLIKKNIINALKISNL